MRYLVTGAHGFIGSHLVEHLLAFGEVRALVSPWGDSTNLRAAWAHPRLEVVRADITEPAALRGVCDGVTAVVHAAARVADWGPAGAFFRTNVTGTRNLLAEAAAAGTPRFVLVSSVAVHRYAGFRNADPEVTPRDGTLTPYGRSKIAAEDAVLAWPGEGVVVRPGLWPFGPRDPNLGRVVAALRRGALPLVGDGSTVLNTAWVGNLVEGLRLAAEVGGVAGRAVVVADPGMPSWRELLSELARLVGTRPPRLSVPPALALPAAALTERAWAALAPRSEPPLTRYRAALMARDVHFSLDKAEQLLGYRPRVSWREALARTVAAGDPVGGGA